MSRRTRKTIKNMYLHLSTDDAKKVGKAAQAQDQGQEESVAPFREKTFMGSIASIALLAVVIWALYTFCGFEKQEAFFLGAVLHLWRSLETIIEAVWGR